ncbi:tetratricopeptide repeat protein [Thermodesulfobacteriota bacterium]
MKKKLIISLFILCSLVSCATQDLELKKRQGEAFRNLGEAYLIEGKYTEALRELLKSEEFYPNDPYLQNDLGLIYTAKKRPDLALVHFEKAVKLNPDYAPAKNNLGTAYLQLEKWDEAIANFTVVSESLLYGTPQYPLLNLGWAYYNKKEYELAEKYYTKAINYYKDGFEKDAVYIKAIRGLSQTYIAMGKIPMAVEILEETIREFPGQGLVHFDLAKAYTLLHDYQKALKAYSAILQIAPDTPVAREAQKEISRLKNLHE